jgi:hypothetical protein
MIHPETDELEIRTCTIPYSSVPGAMPSCTVQETHANKKKAYKNKVLVRMI